MEELELTWTVFVVISLPGQVCSKYARPIPTAVRRSKTLQPRLVVRQLYRGLVEGQQEDEEKGCKNVQARRRAAVLGVGLGCSGDDGGPSSAPNVRLKVM